MRNIVFSWRQLAVKIRFLFSCLRALQILKIDKARIRPAESSLFAKWTRARRSRDNEQEKQTLLFSTFDFILFYCAIKQQDKNKRFSSSATKATIIIVIITICSNLIFVASLEEARFFANKQ